MWTTYINFERKKERKKKEKPSNCTATVSQKVYVNVISIPFTIIDIQRKNSTLGGNFQSEHPIIDKLKAKLDKWKHTPLLKARRLTLANYDLNSLPIYSFSILKAPFMVINVMEKFWLEIFFWKGGAFNLGNHLVNWSWTSLPLQYMGVWGLVACGKGSFTIEVAVGFIHEESSLWRRVIDSICGFDPHGGWPYLQRVLSRLDHGWR